MARWEPAAQERLQTAALRLYGSKGFDVTTVAEIADVAGLTERTFYRYFADKREVLFAGSELLQQAFVDGVAASPKDAAPLDIITAAVIGAAGTFDADRLPHSRLRQSIIGANAELYERELLKMAMLAAALGQALRERGVGEPAATLAAESGVTVFRVAFARWLASGAEQSLPDIEREMFAELRALTGTPPVAA